MRRVFLDTETTGLEPEKGHRIVEVAAIAYDERTPIPEERGGEFRRLINPGREVEKEALKVHGFSDSLLAKQPPFADCAKELAEFLRGSEVVIHNAEFDQKFLNAEFARLKMPPLEKLADRIVCSLVMARRELPGLRTYSLDGLCAHFKVDASVRTTHNALLDVRLLARVYLKMTRGQTSLRMKRAEATRLEAPETVADAPPLLATAQELAAHEAFLDEMQKTEKNTPLWRTKKRVEGGEVGGVGGVGGVG